MRPRSVLLTSTRFGMLRKKYQKSSKNLPETYPKLIKNQRKIEKNENKLMEKAKMNEENQKIRYKCEKSANLSQFEAPEPKSFRSPTGWRTPTLYSVRSVIPVLLYENPFK